MCPANESKGEGIILFRESETVELKEVIVDDIKQESFTTPLAFQRTQKGFRRHQPEGSH